MTAIELLKHYSIMRYRIPFDQDPIAYWKGHKEDHTHRIFRHETLPLQVTVPFAHKESKGKKQGWHIGLYVGDALLQSKSQLRMNPPFGQIADTNYTYYGMYLNLAAYLAQGSVAELFIVLPRADSQKVIVQYKPALAELMCAHLEQSLLQKKGITGQTKMVL